MPSFCRRSHPREQLDRFVREFRLHGQYQPIVVSGNEILCGQLVWQGMKSAGEAEILVNDLGDLPEETRKEIRYLDNQIFDIEDWNALRLKDFLMSNDAESLDGFGFSPEEAERLIDSDAGVVLTDAPDTDMLADLWECDSCGWKGRL